VDSNTPNSSHSNPTPKPRRRHTDWPEGQFLGVVRPPPEDLALRRVSDAPPKQKAHGAREFTFDDWQRLYKSDPEAFEARRRAVLGIELAKIGPKGARARVCLSNLEAHLEGKSGDERARISMLWMAESALQLQEKLNKLTQSLK
jgi:hypothetical protein